MELLVAQQRSCSLAQIVHLHRTRILTAADLRIRFGLPVTSPSRTLLEIAPQLPERRLELALDRCLVDRLLSPSELTELLARAGGHPGRGPLTALLESHRDPAITRSEAEERVLELIRGAQLPAPAVNVRLLGYEVDFLWRAERLVLEVDGFRFHSTRRAFEHDRRKDQTLRAAGFYSTRVTWRQLQSEPLALAARLAQALVWATRLNR
ncbi:MAG: endonuclease domain-containing protein [Trebonia sp.]